MAHHCMLLETLLQTCIQYRWREMLPLLNWVCGPQHPGFKYSGLHHLRTLQEQVYHCRKFDTVDQLGR